MNTANFYVSHALLQKISQKIAAQLPVQARIYPVPRGGVAPAYLLKQFSTPENEITIVDTVEEANCIVDDIIDSGETLARYPKDKRKFAFIGFENNRTWSENICVGYALLEKQWVVFPWEGNETGSTDDIGRRLLQFIGEDPNREGLLETPARFIKAWKEWTAGYRMSVEGLFKDFADGGENYDEMIIINPIPFYSHCEHHLAAIFGTVHIAYIPNGRIAGLSKFCRLVDVFARRLQVQERLTVQIADTINEQLSPFGVGVLVKARHFCMESRGAMKPGVETTTIALRGALKNDPASRSEFLGRVK